MHETLTITVPMVLAVLIAALVNRHDVKDLRRDMDGRFAEVDSRFDSLRAEIDSRFTEVYCRFDLVDAELRHFYGITGKLEGRVDELSKRPR